MGVADFISLLAKTEILDKSKLRRGEAADIWEDSGELCGRYPEPLGKCGCTLDRARRGTQRSLELES